MEQMTDKRVLVTGGAGFIGSGLCEAFLAQGNDVVCLDNFMTGFGKNIEEFRDNGRFTLVEGDIRNIDDCRRAAKGADYVFHHAALGSVPRSINDPALSTEVNVNGTLNMLLAARDAKVKRFIYASSSSVYGDSPGLPKEEGSTGEPLSPYAITKLANEKYAKVFCDVYGMEAAGLRYFNVFGRRQDPEGAYAAVIPKWMGQLVRHERPVINGDGAFSRDFTYIDNVIHANERAALADLQGESHVVLNIAFGGNTTLNELFNILRDNLAAFDPAIAAIEPTYGPERAGDIPHSLASIDKAQKLIGYAPAFDIRSGLKRTCEWFYTTANS